MSEAASCIQLTSTSGTGGLKSGRDDGSKRKGREARRRRRRRRRGGGEVG